METKDKIDTTLDFAKLTRKESNLLKTINKKYDKKKRKELIKLEERKKQYEIKEISSMYTEKKEKKRRTTTKILMAFILGNCTIVEIYSMIVMFVLNDISALYSLIGAVVGESLSFAIYCAKSYKENKEEAINKLERDKFLASMDSNNSDDESDNYPEDDETRDLSDCE